jgi:hypothetical protein
VLLRRVNNIRETVNLYYKGSLVYEDQINDIYINTRPIPVVARSWAWVCRRSLVGLRIRIPPEAWMSVSCVCCQVEVSASG